MLIYSFKKTLQYVKKKNYHSWKKTVSVLPKMNFSHQIQNMEFTHIFPALQREKNEDLQIWRGFPGILQLLSIWSCWISVLDTQAVVIPIGQCMLRGVSPHLASGVQDFGNACSAVSGLVSTAVRVHLCQFTCPNFTVTCEPSHRKRRNGWLDQLLLHIPIPENLQSPSGSCLREEKRPPNEMPTSHSQGEFLKMQIGQLLSQPKHWLFCALPLPWEGQTRFYHRLQDRDERFKGQSQALSNTSLYPLSSRHRRNPAKTCRATQPRRAWLTNL